jgi:hypothetical protein
MEPPVYQTVLTPPPSAAAGGGNDSRIADGETGAAAR